MKEITLDGEIYIPKKNAGNEATKNGLKYVLVRTDRAGCFVGYLQSKLLLQNGFAVKLFQARRLWRWGGAASLSQIAMQGVSKPDECKFPIEVDEIDLIGIEIITVTELAKKNIAAVPVWKE